MASEAINFSDITALIVDSDQYAIEIIAEILRGFGLNKQTSAFSGSAAQDMLSSKPFDLLISEAMLDDMTGATLIAWVRRTQDLANRHMPIVVLTGHTQIDHVIAARDSGANGIVKKPVSPSALFDRLVWSAKSDRTFVETETYIGPDRRFKSVGPPNGIGRRASDLSAEVGVAREPNLSQDEIDAFVKPMKVSLE
jgi:CheY-like chemotaxis protein